MARSKKSDDKTKEDGSLQISVEDFVRTRNSVVTGLATLQSAVSDLSRAYIAHTDTVIGKGTASSLEQLNISNPLSGENALFGQRGPTPAPTIEVSAEGKKRKRAPHDKNAPKRALTPFFLYLQNERPTIATEMGTGKTAKEVQDEGGRRWRAMSEAEKEVWSEKYGINFARYKIQMKSYKAGQGIPIVSDTEAKTLYESSKKKGKAPANPELDPELVGDHGDNEAEEEEDDEDEDEEEAAGKTEASEEESSEESPEPVKAPPPKRTKTAKDTADKKTVVKANPVKEAEPVVVDRASKSPEKKKKKGSKKKDAKVVEVAVESKNEVVAESPSPPPKAASPEKTKKAKGKKRKSEAA